MAQAPPELCGDQAGCAGSWSCGWVTGEVCGAGVGAPSRRDTGQRPGREKNRFFTVALRVAFTVDLPLRGLEAGLRSGTHPSFQPGPRLQAEGGEHCPAQSVGGTAPWWPPGSLPRGAGEQLGPALLQCGSRVVLALPGPHLPSGSRGGAGGVPTPGVSSLCRCAKTNAAV